MTDNIPSTMKAIVIDSKTNWVTIKDDVPTPEPGDNQVLIKVAYAAQNPSDWKFAAFLSVDGDFLGSDYSGTVVKVGTNLQASLQVGDKIAGAVLGGGFGEYLTVDSDLAFRVPQDISLEDASTFGVAWGTAGQVIFKEQKHAYPPSKVEGSPWYIVYGGSTSVGLFAIQIVKRLGYKVLAFASPHSYDLVKSYGADAVVNYRDDDAVEQALKITGGGAELGFDTISEGTSFSIVIPALREKGKQLNVINMITDEIRQINPKIELVHTMFHTLLGKELNFGARTPETPMIIPVVPENHRFGTTFFPKTEELISKYGIKANPVALKGGLEAISQGLKDQMEGKVSGKKLVYKIA
ncbi:uncharacterized protein IL334_003799 [Kwoniella shivajii]|uniref:Enoyl reductase (ER) domain-containing protein n=1 Tax=Kwoniella shivajii TaxID=564305 RepID=A0ABZ1CYJ5_9TREE|nr:hypothetical protein IL334_003799 [Kwoniella shivajii]